jgi:2-phosphosulfolactate phosphatase
MSKPKVYVKWRRDGEAAGKGDVAVVVDVLRACTTLITAFSIGAKRCKITTEVEEARQIARGRNAILIGERNNKRIAGFDFGNSPGRLQREIIDGATIVFTSTNFPDALAAAAEAAHVLLGALVNLSAVCQTAYTLASDSKANIAMILAGEPAERHAKEDYYFAGRAARFLSETCVLDDSARKAVADVGGRSQQEMISCSVHARELIEAGFGQDVRDAFMIDQFDIVPILVNGWLTVA